MSHEPQTPSTPEDEEAFRVTISLPKEFSKRLAVSQSTKLPVGDWSKVLAVKAVERYGGGLKNSTSKIFRLALEELWHAYNVVKERASATTTAAPDIEQVQLSSFQHYFLHLAEIHGIVGALRNFDEFDWSNWLLEQSNVFIQIESLTDFVRSKHHLDGFVKRLSNPDTSTFILTDMVNSHRQRLGYEILAERQNDFRGKFAVIDIGLMPWALTRKTQFCILGDRVGWANIIRTDPYIFKFVAEGNGSKGFTFDSLSTDFRITLSSARQENILLAVNMHHNPELWFPPEKRG